MLSTVLQVLLAATTVSAHATFQELWVNGVDQGGSCVRLPLNNNPITSVSGPDIACNTGTSPVPGTCTVQAGGTVTPEMHQQPGDRSCSELAIGGAHHGPTLVYLAKVADATTAVGSSAKWFKIFHSGLINDNPIPGYWGNDLMNDNCGQVGPVTIPADIPAGDYLLRAETIALHTASGVGGAQFYASCYQLKITGGGSASPATVSFPGAYSATDPGIEINIYQTLNSYTIPGPPVYVASGGGSPGSTTVTKPITTTTIKTLSGPTTTSKATTTTTTTKTTTSAPSTGTPVAHYGQCGGIGWTGSTVCASPYVCTANGAYYSQCI